MISFVEENYLKALFQLSGEDGEVNVKDLSEELGIKMSTVTSMMKKFAEKGLVHYESYRPLRLTGKGKKEAGLVLRKHRLTEMFLVERMGFGWEEVHEIAEQVEIQIKYDGYIKRQLKQVEQFKKLENRMIPSDIRYHDIKGLRIEARQKLDQIRPLSLGQASRISGVSPADISVLMIHMEQIKRQKAKDDE